VAVHEAVVQNDGPMVVENSAAVAAVGAVPTSPQGGAGRIKADGAIVQGQGRVVSVDPAAITSEVGIVAAGLVQGDHDVVQGQRGAHVVDTAAPQVGCVAESRVAVLDGEVRQADGNRPGDAQHLPHRVAVNDGRRGAVAD